MESRVWARRRPRQITSSRQVFEFIVAYMTKSTGIQPSTREIGAGMGIGTSTAHYHVNRLIQAGKLERQEGARARGYRVVGAQWIPPE